MNCNNCGYGLKQRCGDFEKILCTYENGECVKITELEQQIKKMKCLLNEIYSEFGFSELVKVRNDLPTEIQEVL